MTRAVVLDFVASTVDGIRKYVRWTAREFFTEIAEVFTEIAGINLRHPRPGPYFAQANDTQFGYLSCGGLGS
jgi:hypothetical protein